MPWSSSQHCGVWSDGCQPSHTMWSSQNLWCLVRGLSTFSYPGGRLFSILVFGPRDVNFLISGWSSFQHSGVWSEGCQLSHTMMIVFSTLWCLVRGVSTFPCHNDRPCSIGVWCEVYQVSHSRVVVFHILAFGATAVNSPIPDHLLCSIGVWCNAYQLSLAGIIVVATLVFAARSIYQLSHDGIIVLSQFCVWCGGYQLSHEGIIILRALAFGARARR
jgi:hypothetical protein